MTTHTSRSAMIDKPTHRPAQWGRDLGQRITRLIRGIDERVTPATETDTSEWPSVPPPPSGESPSVEPGAAPSVDESQAPPALQDSQAPPSLDERLPRFPYARRGYECAAVDEYVTALESELADLDHTLAELRARVEEDAVAGEIKRLGEETSSVLIAAHETREEMLREAQAEVDRRLAEAATQASAMIAEQESRARELQERNESLRTERDRMLDQVRSVSKALAEVADSAGKAE